MHIPTLGEVTGCIVAYRAWKVDGYKLRAVSMDTPWPAREPLRKACVESPWGRMSQIAPGRLTYAQPCDHSMCGIYGMKEKWQLFRDTCTDTCTHGSLLYGTVALWGEIKEHTKGYRAQYAYPLELIAEKLTTAVEATAGAYAVPVRRMSDEESQFIAAERRAELDRIQQQDEAFQANMAKFYRLYGGYSWTSANLNVPTPSPQSQSAYQQQMSLINSQLQRSLLLPAQFPKPSLWKTLFGSD